MSTVAKIQGIAIANIAKINGVAKASISKWNGVDIPSGSYIGTLTLIFDYGGELPAEGDSVVVYPNGVAWMAYSNVVGTTSVIDWQSDWGASGDTYVTVETYGSRSLIGNTTIIASDVLILNGGGSANMGVTMAEAV